MSKVFLNEKNKSKNKREGKIKENNLLLNKNDIDNKILFYIKPIMQLVRDGITFEKYMKEPLICLSMLCKSLKNLMYEHVLSLMGLEKKKKKK